MRILGADSFTGRQTSINAIPRNVVSHEDMCVVKIGADDSGGYIPGVYFYEYRLNDGNPEEMPNIIIPFDNIVGSDDGSRWKLKGIYANEIFTDAIHTNNILPATSGSNIYINNNLGVSPSGVFISNGPLNIITNIQEPPFIINSNVMVENLNAEYINGIGIENFLINRNYHVQLPNGATEVDVFFPHAIVSPPHYTVFIEICNIIDINPSIYSYVVTHKTADFFRVKFSGVIDSPNYTMHYFVIGETYPYVTPPPSGLPPIPEPEIPEDQYPWYIVNVDTNADIYSKYMVDTSGGPVTITAPSNPSPNDKFVVGDYRGTFGNANCTIDRNGRKIEGQVDNLILDLNNKTVKMVYLNDDFGWKVIW